MKMRGGIMLMMLGPDATCIRCKERKPSNATEHKSQILLFNALHRAFHPPSENIPSEMELAPPL